MTDRTPWTLDPQPISIGRFIKAGPETVALVYATGDKDENQRRTFTKANEATARLIIEAEPMRAVIERLLKWADYTGGWDSPAWRDAEAILRKVEGHAEPEAEDTTEA